MTDHDKLPEEIHFRDIAPAIEFICWTFVVLVPILRLINGAAVTNDQFVMQVALFAVPLTAAIGLRLYAFLRR